MKIMSVFGTRPEAIKMCPVVRELEQRSGIECVVCLTGQHEEMLNQVIEIFKIKVKYNLHIMRKNQTLSDITSDILTRLDSIMAEEEPDMVLVHGDTSSSFAAALSAFYHHIPIGHIEAGLRTYNMQSPYPEEFNRQTVDLITDLFFAPTEHAKKQLLLEKKDESKVFVTGNTVIDALKTTVNKDYLDFDLWFKNDSNISIYLDKNSYVYPECCSNANDAILNLNNNRSDIVRLSSYGDFSRDLIAGAVRVAFINYEYDNSSSKYVLDDKPVYIWAPNKNYEIVYQNGYYEFNMNSTNYENYSYLKVTNSTNFKETRLTNVKDEINASYADKTSAGDEKLFDIKSTGNEVKFGLKVRIWIEGTDREAVEALKGGRFKFNLSFVGFTKVENNNTPKITLDSENNLAGLNESMEYSVDNGINWIPYKNDTIVSLNNRIILVRYMETDEMLASSYITVGGNNE